MDSRIIEAKLKHIRQSFVTNSWPIGTWEARLGTHLAPERTATIEIGKAYRLKAGGRQVKHSSCNRKPGRQTGCPRKTCI
jgi:hypothetical protein